MSVRIKIYNPHYKPGERLYLLGDLFGIRQIGEKEYYIMSIDGQVCTKNRDGLFWFNKDLIKIDKVISDDEEKRDMVEKQRRIQLYEDDELILERRNNKYFLSFYDEGGMFRREVTIVVKDDFKVTTCDAM